MDEYTYVQLIYKCMDEYTYNFNHLCTYILCTISNFHSTLGAIKYLPKLDVKKQNSTTVYTHYVYVYMKLVNNWMMIPYTLETMLYTLYLQGDSTTMSLQNFSTAFSNCRKLWHLTHKVNIYK